MPTAAAYSSGSLVLPYLELAYVLVVRPIVTYIFLSFLTTSVHTALFFGFYAHNKKWQSSQLNDSGRFPVELEADLVMLPDLEFLASLNISF